MGPSSKVGVPTNSHLAESGFGEPQGHRSNQPPVMGLFYLAGTAAPCDTRPRRAGGFGARVAGGETSKEDSRPRAALPLFAGVRSGLAGDSASTARASAS